MAVTDYRPSRVLQSLRYRAYSPTDHYVVLRRDLQVPFEAPDARIPIEVRPLAVPERGAVRAAIEELDGYERSNRIRFLDDGPGQCFVAWSGDQVAYAQWLIGPDDADQVAAETRLPVPREGEAVLEHAFTAPAFRGQGVMAAAMARIAERASALGARYVLTVVADDNVPSLKGCAKAGFHPHVRKDDAWRLFRHRVTYLPLDTAAPRLGQ